MEKKLFLLDAYALIYRAYYSFAKNHRINSAGLNTSAQYGFTNTLYEVIQKQKPTHLAVVFDMPGSVDTREAIYADYKANREETPEDIKLALPYIEKIVEGFNIPVIKLPGYEADDLIGTLSVKAYQEGFTTYMMTPDKDYGQLVNDRTFMYKPGRFGKPSEVWGVNEICEKFDIEHPSQVIDILGLWGDAVDNIPGIPGVGEKTAKKLLAQYKTLENVLENAHEVKGKLGEKIANNKEQAKVSKILATIILDAPISFNAEELRLEEPNKEALKMVFSELEFRALSKRILGEQIAASTQKKVQSQLSIFDTSALTEPSLEAEDDVSDFKAFTAEKQDYQLVDAKEKFNQLCKALKDCSEFCFDTETTGLDTHTAELLGIAFSLKEQEAYYLPITEHNLEHLEALKPLLEHPKILKIAHNLKYDMNILKKYGIQVATPYFDTMVAHYLLRPDSKHSMDILSESYLNYRPISIETLIGKKGKNQKTMASLLPSEVKDYACEDADITLRLKSFLAPKLKERGLENLFFDLEMPLISVLSGMEAEGIRLDKNMLSHYSKELESKLLALEKEIKSYAKEDFNLDSPRQLGNVLFDELKIVDKPKKTKTGQYATSEDVLVSLRDAHPIMSSILEYRALRKLKNTYVDPLPLLAKVKTDRIHTSYMQTIASTGRLSSVKPNLQNIPIKTTEGQMVRKAFIAKDSDYILLAADYSQIELRIIAALSGDENMIQAFKSGKDIHASTASKIFGVDIKKVERSMRIKAKAVNFGIIYGQTPFGLAKSIGIPRKEAAQIIEAYFKEYPRISQYISDIQALAKEQGYVETIFGRKRYLKDINSNNSIVRAHAERNAINAPIQGSAADIIKRAMIAVYYKLLKEKTKSKLLLQVHDELVFDVYKPELDKVKKIVQSTMESAADLPVPLEVDMGTGVNWLEAH